MHYFRTDILRSILNDKLDHNSQPVRLGHLSQSITKSIETMRVRLVGLWRIRDAIRVQEDKRAALYDGYRAKAEIANAVIENLRQECPHTSLDRYGCCKICQVRPGDPIAMAKDGIADRRLATSVVDGPMYVDYEIMSAIMGDMFVGLPLVDQEAVNGGTMVRPDLVEHYVTELNRLLVIDDKVYRLREERSKAQVVLETAHTEAVAALRAAQDECPHRSLRRDGTCQVCDLKLNAQR